LSFKLKDISRRIHVSQGSLSDLENDKSLPSARTLTNLCLFTDLNLCWLLTGKGAVARVVDEGARESHLYREFLLAMQDKKLRELYDRLVRIYTLGDNQKRANLVGYLTGADPGVQPR